MTGLAGVFGPAARGSEGLVSAMARRTPGVGDAAVESWCGPNAVLAACRPAWEKSLDGWTGPLICVADDLVLAADASLYYVADLRRRLAAHVDLSSIRTSAELIAAAVRRWGDRFAGPLEGDFAVIVWDRARSRVLLSRDLCGRRSLAFATLDDGSLVVASTAVAVASLPGVPSGYDLDVLAASAACFMTGGDRTAFSRIRPLRSGRTLGWRVGERAVTVDQWIPPRFSEAWIDGPPSDDDADELRAILERSVLERLPRSDRASVWMSGGWDSTAVFASGRAALAATNRSSVEILPVSVSYPEGDAGYEDHYIRDVAARWSAPVRWIAADSISIAEDAERRRRLRDDPMPHHFEMMQRTLARASRELGTRIVLDGFGGDQLFFASSDAVLGDHLFYGRLGTLAHAWRRQRERSVAAFLRRCVLPFAPPEFLEWMHAVTGRRPAGAMELSPPSWIRSSEALLQRSADVAPRHSDEALSQFETRFLLETPYMARVMSWTHQFAADEGIQIRSPMYDPRVIAFAATRPLSERFNGREGKILLRRAMRELIPGSVLAPRGRKTGTSNEYFRRQLTQILEQQVKPALRGRLRELRLCDLGLVDAEALERAIDAFVAKPDHLLAAQLFTTYETEQWLAMRDGKP
jgi:asparagine synthase (glutamine-hydrolysing)